MMLCNCGHTDEYSTALESIDELQAPVEVPLLL